jgi:hypothetical protein
MSAPRALPLIVTVMTLAAPHAHAAETLWTSVTVRVYDATGESVGWQSSFDLAARIVSATSVEITWIRCDSARGPSAPGSGPTSAAAARCSRPLAPGELALRIVRLPAPRAFQGELPLGDALIDRRTGAGVLATVYFDRVLWMANQTGGDARALLGRAIAHELGHLLLASNTHSPLGLMRAVWSREELRQSRSGDWMFGVQEIAAIRTRTRAR